MEVLIYDKLKQAAVEAQATGVHDRVGPTILACIVRRSREMKFLFVPYAPRFGLADHVQFFWYAYGNVNQMKEKVLPNGVVEWIVNMGPSAHLVLDSDDHGCARAYKNSWIAGMQERPLLIQSTGETKLFGIRFKPGGMAPFVHASLGEFTNGVYELDTVMGPAIACLREQLLELERKGLFHQFRKLEAFLRSRYRESGRVRHMDAIVQALYAAQGRSIRSLSDDLGISHKHLIAIFREAVGLKPKTLQRIVQFQRALKLMSPAGQRPSLAAIAHQLGYSDQAHFNHEFKSISGVAPSAYLRMRTSDPNHINII